MKIYFNLLLMALVIFSACSNPSGNDRTSVSDENQETVVERDFENGILGFGFTISYDLAEDLETYKTYNNVKIFKDGNEIFYDNQGNEYVFTNPKIPMVLKINDNHFEILLEIDGRPNMNTIRHLKIIGNNVENVNTLPLLSEKAIDIDNDGIPEYVGIWNHTQIWGDNEEFMAYNPILYFALTEKGLLINEKLTIEKNKQIYGAFHGFEFDGDNVQSSENLAQIGRELDVFK